MRSFVQSLLATAIIALPAHGSPVTHPPVTQPTALALVTPVPAEADACTEAVAAAGAVYAWHMSSFLFCPTGLCIPLVEASGYALMLATAYAITVCAI